MLLWCCSCSGSAAKGSTYEFMELPDLKKGSLALSSILVLNNKDDAVTFSNPTLIVSNARRVQPSRTGTLFFYSDLNLCK